MKKAIWKRLIAATMLAGVLISLCSCQFLDELKSLHAVWANEQKTEILFQGRTFHKLPAAKDRFPILVNKTMNSADFKRGNLTETDVPVLLSGTMGSLFVYNDEITLLQIDNSYSYKAIFDADYAYSETTDYFAEESLYETYKTAMESPLDHLGYFYQVWDEENQCTYEKTVRIDAATRSAVLKALAQPALPEETFDIERDRGYFCTCDAGYLISGAGICHLSTATVEGKTASVLVDPGDNAYLLDEAIANALLEQTKDEFDYDSYWRNYYEEPDFAEEIASL